MNNQTRLILLTFFVVLTYCSVQTVCAANFSVDPVRVILDVQHRTERMVVKNNSDKPLTLLIKSYHWTQPNEGKDQYEETEELIVFPRALTLTAGEERSVRVGIPAPAGQQEKAFRIYLEEQPLKDELSPDGASARVLMRVGIPVFAQPLKPESELKVKELEITRSNLSHTLTNTGNSYITAEEITVNALDTKGAEVFARNLGGTYLLAGSTRTYDVAIPKDQCKRISQISVTTRSDGKYQLNKLNVTAAACEGK
jgi:fimbrial chaperone protein